MRRIMSILLTALVAFGCAKEELAVPETSGNMEVSSGVDMSSINFAIKNGLENWGTKASVVEGFATGDAISVAAFQGTDECFNEAITNTTGGWVMSEGRHYYWESYNAEYNGTDALDFCFVYPEQTISNKSFTYTLEANPARQEDLLVKYLAGTKASADYSPVKVEMDHALSLLAFEAIAEESEYVYKVGSITINKTDGFYNQGTYTFGSGWESESLAKQNGGITSLSSPITNSTVTSSGYTDVNDGNYCLLLPQEVTSMSINVSYSVVKSGTTYTDTKVVTLENKTFAEGKKYTYGIKLPKLPAVQLIPLSTPFVWTSSISKTELEFTWTCDDESLVGGYDLYWSTSDEPTISGSPNATTKSKTYTVNVGSNKTKCYFAVVAKPNAEDEEHEASAAGTTFATTGNKVLTPPTISVSDIGGDYLEFTWNAVDNADKYIIKDYSTGKDLATITGTTYKWTGLNGGTKYTIGIVATRTKDNSYDPSPEAYKSATTLLLADWWGAVNKSEYLWLTYANNKEKIDIVLNKAKGLLVTYNFDNTNSWGEDIKLEDAGSNAFAYIKREDTNTHKAYIPITDAIKSQIKNLVSGGGIGIKVYVPWDAYVEKIEYAY